jgi:hypothetical protein
MAQQIAARLEHRAVLEVAGEDRRSFLQGLVSNDMAKVSAERAVWTAMLTPQGKFLFDMFVAELGEVLLIDAEADRIEELKKKLTMYKLRSKVTLALRPDLQVWGVVGGDILGEAGAARSLGGGVAFVDPRDARAGARLLVAEPPAAQGAFADWDANRIRLGLPDGGRDMVVDKALLLENGFDELGGVDFKKGCYMGQELTARTKHRGLIKKRLLPVEIDGPAPAPGTELTLDGAEAGEMRSSAGNVGLALVRLEALRKSPKLSAGGATLTVGKPDWAMLPEGE